MAACPGFIRHAVSGFVTACFLVAAPAQADGAMRATVTLVSDHVTVAPGADIRMGLSFRMDPGWHIYWRNPGDAGIAPKITWNDDSGAETKAVAPPGWPTPELLPISPGEIMDYGYSGNVVLPFKVKIADNASGTAHLHGRVDYLVCKTICRPETADIGLRLSVTGENKIDLAGQRLIRQAVDKTPVPFAGKATFAAHDDGWLLSLDGGQLVGLRGPARFFPHGQTIVHAASQAVRFGPQHVHIQLTPAPGLSALPQTLDGVVALADRAVQITARQGTVPPDTLTDTRPATSWTTLAILIMFGLLGGLILNLMPCVLPVLSIKAVGLIMVEPGKARRHGLWYTAGVLTGFSGFAVAIIVLRALAGIVVWGFWLQNPLVVAGLTLILFLIGMWLLGWVEPAWPVQNTGNSLAAKPGNAGAFFTGMLAAVAGAPCTGPFLGTTIGAVMFLEPVSVFAVLLATGLGLALPFLIVSFIPNLQRLLPRPGVWSGILKQFFAFPVFLAVVWLLVILGQLAGAHVMAATITGIILIGFSVWAFKMAEPGGRVILTVIAGFVIIITVLDFTRVLSMSYSDRMLSGILLVAIAAAIWQVHRFGAQTCTRITKIAAIAIGLGGGILPVAMISLSRSPATIIQADVSKTQAETWSPERVNDLIDEGRPVFVDFTAAWCVTCQVNKLRVLQARPVINAFDKVGAVVLVADFTRHDGQIARELQKYGRAGVPMYLWYPPGERTPRVLPEVLSVNLITRLAQTP